MSILHTPCLLSTCPSRPRDAIDAKNHTGIQGVAALCLFSVVSSGFTRFLCLQYKGRLSLRAVKFFLDGALGSRGAALLAPYSDAPAQRGQLRLTEANYSAAVAAWVKNGWQVGPPMPLEIPQ